MNITAVFSGFLYAHATQLLRWAIGINYFWFGMLKFFNGLSPAEHLAKDTIRIITFGLIPDEVNLFLLATWEVAIGLIFLSGYFTRLGALAAVVHMLFTFLPLFFFPEVSFSHAPYGFTIVGQYIVKNLVFVAALIIILKEQK
ncbi:MAG: DoxX family protein [Saprospiraceae bacterium]|nr:DoxX family protein [Saprospiraceae bacterium]